MVQHTSQPNETRASRQKRERLRERLIRIRIARKWLTWPIALAIFWVTVWTAAGIQSGQLANPFAAEEPNPSRMIYREQEALMRELFPGESPYRIPPSLEQTMYAISKPGSTITEDFPELPPDAEQKIEGRDTAVWIIPEGYGYGDFTVQATGLQGDPVLMLVNPKGYILELNDNCMEASVMPCLHAVFVTSQTIVILFDREGKPLSASLTYHPAAKVPTNITALRVTGTTDTRIRLEWDDPNPTGNNQYYLVEELFDYNNPEKIAITREKGILLENIEPQTKHVYRVTAVSKNGGIRTDNWHAKVLASTYGTLPMTVPRKLEPGISRWVFTGHGKPVDLFIYKESPILYVHSIKLKDATGRLISSYSNLYGDPKMIKIQLPVMMIDEQFFVEAETYSNVDTYSYLFVQERDVTPPSKPVIANTSITKKDWDENLGIDVSWIASKDDRGTIRYELACNDQVVKELRYLNYKCYPAVRGSTVTIKVRAADLSGNVSEWSEPVSVQVPEGLAYRFYFPALFKPDYQMMITYRTGDGLEKYKMVWLSETKTEWNGYPMADADLPAGAKVTAVELKALKRNVYEEVKIALQLPAGGIQPGMYWMNGNRLEPGRPEGDAVMLYYPSMESADQRPTYVHYRLTGSGWTSAPGIRMSDATLDYYRVLRIALKPGQRMEEAAFYTENGRWDNNNGRNYSIGAGSWVMRDGVVVSGTAADAKLQPKQVEIHYCSPFWTDSVYVHYRTDVTGWTSAPGIKLDNPLDDWGCKWIKLTIAGLGKEIPELAFYNETVKRWDNNGGKNYRFQPGRWMVRNGAVSVYAPPAGY